MIIKKSTVDMPREKWLEIRRASIGGSDAGALLGLNPYTSPYALWAEKTGRVIPDDISQKEAVRLGNDLEQYVAERFTEATGKKVRRCNAILYNTARPYAHANPDRMIIGENAGLECKTTSNLSYYHLLEKGQFPETWYAQITHYLMVTGAERWYLAAIVFGKGFYHFCIERNEEEIKALSTAEIDFWALVQANVPPDVDGAESTTQAISQMFPSSESGPRVDLMPMTSALYAWQATKEQLEKLKAILQEQQNQICEYMGSAESGASGEFKVSWKTQSRKTFDAKRFAQDHPELDLSAYYKESTSRPFKLTKI